MYVFDNSPLSVLFKNYYPRRFPSLWKEFDGLVAAGHLVSTREVLREIEDSSIESLRVWCRDNGGLFGTPTAQEAGYVAAIFAVPHFQQNIEKQKLLNGGLNADPFVIARAMAEGRTVVTMEVLKPNAAKIPNICDHFGIPWLGLEDFMEKQGWQF